MSKINELKIKYKMLQEMPKSREFLGTIMDFNILTSLDESRSDAYMNQRFSENDYNHCINSINSFINPEPKANKENFSLNLIIQMNELLSGEIQEQKKELIQALYITIFSKYNIDKDHANQYKINPELLNLIYRLDGDSVPDRLSEYETSDEELGCIYMSRKQYKALLSNWMSNSDFYTRRDAFKNDIAQFVLDNIRRRTFNQEFENTTDIENNDIVVFYPSYKFKARFFFDFIVEFYETISKQIQLNNPDVTDILFEFEKVLLNKSNSDIEIMNNKDILISIILQLYLNSFIANSLDEKKVNQNIEDNSTKKQLIDLYYQSNNENCFAEMVAKYNQYYYDKNYSAEDIIKYFEHSIKHNTYNCKYGIIHIEDFDENNNQIADFVIPYNLFEELLSIQSEKAKQNLFVTNSIE